jgi:hypothetical protein
MSEGAKTLLTLADHLEKKNDLRGLELLSALMSAIIEEKKSLLDQIRAIMNQKVHNS